MKIESSNLSLQSQSQSYQNMQTKEKIGFSINGESATIQEVNQGVKKAVYDDILSSVNQSAIISNNEDDLSIQDQTKKRVIEELMSQLFGKKIKLEPSGHKEEVEQKRVSANDGFSWSYTIEQENTNLKSEQIAFDAKGIVKTQDNHQISFDIQLGISQTLFEKSSTLLEKKETLFKDPLVIQLDSDITKLSQTKFSFDIDSDGVEDSISYLKKGSVYLAYDKNGNKNIDNGNELFGTQSGDGFSGLKQYDSDGNNWIDENDPIFKKLQVWENNEDGESKLLALGEVGIGALYLGHVNTPLTTYDSDMNVAGKLKESGIYLKENGDAGVIHQIDLAT